MADYDKIKIKPCPFCGGDAQVDFSLHGFVYTDSNGNSMDTGFFYTVRCNNDQCGCTIGIYQNPLMAIDAWNNRKE